MLKELQGLYDDLMLTNSKLEKLKVLKKYPQCREILKYVYNPMWVYGVTSDNLIKNKELISEIAPINIVDLLDSLRLRKITGHEAIAQVNAFVYCNEDYKDLIYMIINRNLKASIGIKEINKVWKDLIPEFKVQLADKYNEKINPVGMFASRKLDGNRLLTIFDSEGSPSCFSRTGKEFFTLDILKESFKLIPLKLKKDKVLDGEICLLDENGNEDFAGIMKLIRKKDYTIKNPHYKVFDYITLKEFQEAKGTVPFSIRYTSLKKLQYFFNPEFVSIPLQIIVKSIEHFKELQKDASERGWEGLILKTANLGYQGKRSKNLLKVKNFFDAEFIVTGIEITTKKMLNENGLMEEVKCLKAVEIEFEGNKVFVGSGWSDAQRIEYYNNPEKIIGKTITVQYFEVSKDSKTGLSSLRFPTVKYVYEQGRDI